MSKEQVMNYVMNSPANTNPNVLSGMLDSIAESGGTSLVTKTYTLSGQFNANSVYGGASVSLSEPIAPSKVRAMWLEVTQINCIGNFSSYQGNLSADQAYQIVCQFVRDLPSNPMETQPTPISAILHITMEE